MYEGEVKSSNPRREGTSFSFENATHILCIYMNVDQLKNNLWIYLRQFINFAPKPREREKRAKRTSRYGQGRPQALAS